MKDVGAFPDDSRSEKPHAISAQHLAIKAAQADELHEYMPRRDPPSNSFSSPPLRERYTIIDRVPAADSVPRYILHSNQSQNTSQHMNSDTESFLPLLRVTLYDIEDYVSKREIERFENKRYVTGEEDYSSPQEWMRRFKRARKYGLGIYRKYPNVQVVVYQKKRPLDDDTAELSTIHHGTLKRKKLSINGSSHPVTSFLPSAGETPVSSTASDDKGEEFSVIGERENVPEECNEEYEISRVIAHRDVMGLRWYLVTWVGHADSEATWLCEEDLEDAKESIEAYLDRQSSDEAQLWADAKESADE